VNVFSVNSEIEALNLFFMGNANRITASTSMNDASSRSHAIFTVVLKSNSVCDGKRVFKSGKINLVDLAGSERMYKVRTHTNNASVLASVLAKAHTYEHACIHTFKFACMHTYMHTLHFHIVETYFFMTLR